MGGVSVDNQWKCGPARHLDRGWRFPLRGFDAASRLSPVLFAQGAVAVLLSRPQEPLSRPGTGPELATGHAREDHKLSGIWSAAGRSSGLKRRPSAPLFAGQPQWRYLGFESVTGLAGIEV